MIRVLTWLVVLWMTQQGLALGAATVAGRVVDAASGDGLAGVALRIEVSGSAWDSPAPTGPDGRFSLDLTSTFPADALDTDALFISLNKTGFRPVTRIMRAQRRGELTFTQLELPLTRVAGGGGLAPDERTSLEQFKSTSGRTLFLLPYELDSEEAADNLNRRLPFHLKRGINTHLQSLQVDNPPEAIGIERMPVNVSATNTEKVRDYGVALNALAIVSGQGGIAEGTTVEVASEYLIIPDLPGVQLQSFYVDDRFPENTLRSGKLFERLQALWGGNTVLAVAVLDINQAIAAQPKDASALQRTRAYLLAQRRQLGPADGAVVAQINALLALIDEELAP